MRTRLVCSLFCLTMLQVMWPFGARLAAAGDAELAQAASDSTYLIVVYGDTQSGGASFPMPTGTVVTWHNLRTGGAALGTVGTSSRGYYEAVFFATDEFVAAVGDTLEVGVDGANFVAPNGRYVLTAEDILLGAANVDVTPDGMSAAPLPVPMSRIARCFPNPFNPVVTISLTVQETSSAELSVYDVQGHRIVVLHDGVLAAGLHEMSWNGRDTSQLAVASGTYLVIFRTPSGVSGQKLLLAR